MSEELLRQLSRLLANGGAGADGLPSALDLADALWMAAVADLRATRRVVLPDLGRSDLPLVDTGEEEAADEAWDAALRAALDRVSRPEDASGTTPPGLSGPSAQQTVPLFLPREARPEVPLAAQRPAAVVRAPARPVLPDALALSRALRPLKRRVRSARNRTLDVDATIDVSSGLGMLYPVWRAAEERWLDVDLVVDESPSMSIWASCVPEVTTLLNRVGAFRGVRCWSLVHSPSGPRVTPYQRHSPAAAARSLHSLEALGDRSRRRLVLLLTDGVAPAGQQHRLIDALVVWSRTGPVAVLQVLPRRLWSRTTLRPVPIRTRMRVQEHPVQVFRNPAAPAGKESRDWAPLLELRAGWLLPWARVLSGRHVGWARSLAVSLDPQEPDGTLLESAEGEADAFEPTETETDAIRLARFRREASPLAYRLAGFLAAAPLNLPVMRHVQHAMLPGSTPMHLAEVYLSGLLVPKADVPEAEDPEEVVYDFRGGVRALLLDTLTRVESKSVLDVLAGVSGSVSGSLGKLDFRALAPLAGSGSPVEDRIPEQSIPFAEVAVAVLEGLGGEHRRLARRLAVSLNGGGAGAPADTAEARPSAEAATDGDPADNGRRWWPSRRKPTTSVEVTAAPTTARPPMRGVWAPQGVEAATSLGWNNLPSRRPVMTGREHLLARVETALHPPSGLRSRPPTYPAQRSVCVLQGPSGEGKTDVALAYARLHRHDYSLVWWVDGRSHASIHASLTQLSTSLGYYEGAEEAIRRGDGAPPRLSDGTRQWLRENPGWLLVLDDLGSEIPESESWLASFAPATLLGSAWPPEHYGSVLVTTRVPVTDARAGSVTLVTLGAHRASPGRAADGDASGGTQDGEELGALPDLLARTAAIATPETPTAQSLRPSPEQPDETDPAWNTRLLELAQQSPESLAVLNLCSFLAPVGISSAFVTRGLSAVVLPGGGFDGDQRAFTANTLTALTTSRLLRIAPDNRTGGVRFVVPTAVQRAVRTWLGRTGRLQWAAVAVQLILDTFPDNPTEPASWDQCLELLPHAHAVLQLTSLPEHAIRQQATLLHRIAQFRASRGETGHAQAYLGQEVMLRRELGDVGHAGSLGYLLLAEVLRSHGDYRGAEEQCEQALALLDGYPDSSLGRLRCRLLRLTASIHRDQLDYAGSLDRLHEAERSLSAAGYTSLDAERSDLEPIWILREHAVSHLSAGRLRTAGRLLEAAWTRLQRVGSETGPSAELLATAIWEDRTVMALLRGEPSLSEVQLLYRSLPRLGTRQNQKTLEGIMSASEVIVDVLLAHLQLLGRRWHGARNHNFENIRRSELETAAGVAEAVLVYRRTRQKWQPHLYARCLDIHAALKAAQGDAAAALDELDISAALHGQLHGGSHPAWADHCCYRSRILLDLRRGEEATALLLEAQRLILSRLGDRHPKLLAVYSMLAEAASDPQSAAEWRARLDTLRRDPELRPEPGTQRSASDGSLW